MFRKFQVRDFNGLYSVVFHKDLANGRRETYEHTKHIDLPYEDAVKLANEFEELYANSELTINTNDQKTWEMIDAK